MSDCFSLPNAAELVEELKVCASDCSYLQNGFDLHNGSIMFRAADAIEQLMQENAKLKAERDAAVALLKEESYCYSCKQCTERDGNECWCAASNDWSEWYDGCDAWEWRGVLPDEPCESCSLDDLWEQIDKKNGGN